jgi:hypothetical protein
MDAMKKGFPNAVRLASFRERFPARSVTTIPLWMSVESKFFLTLKHLFRPVAALNRLRNMLLNMLMTMLITKKHIQ